MMSQLLMSVLAQRKQAIGPTWQAIGYTWDENLPVVDDGSSCSLEGSYARSSISDIDLGYVLFECRVISPVLITATFDSDGGSPTYSSQSGYDSLNVTNPGTPTRSGYTFNGWSPTLPRTITSNTTFTAQWEITPMDGNYVRFVSASARTITPKYNNSGVTLQYSVNSGATWTTIASGTATTSATEHWFRGQATGTKSLFTAAPTTNAWTFSGSSDLEVYGNLNFLLCDTLGDEVAPTSLGTYAYANMFRDCTSLTTPPELPATTLANSCYQAMFYGCTSLTTAPELPTTTLASYCYTSMFQGCTSLTTAPELPATTLANNCYDRMFQGCSSLKVSATNTGLYTHAWRIPTSGTGTTATNWNSNMLTDTGGTFTSNPSMNTTYYVENEPV